MRDIRKRCIDREPLLGTFAAIPHPVAIEVTCQAGLDFLCIDGEHAQISRETLENLVRAAEIHRVPALVRVPGHGPEAIAAALDAGAQGIIAPRIGTPEQAEAVVRAARFPPSGARGVGPGRAAGYGYRIPDYLARANAEIIVAAQVETAEGLANAEAIAAVDGVDLVFIGPGDLSVSLDAVGPAGAETLSLAIEAIIAAALKHGKATGIFCAKPNDARRWAAYGVSFFMLASDTMFLGAGVAEGVAFARAELAGTKAEGGGEHEAP